MLEEVNICSGINISYIGSYHLGEMQAFCIIFKLEGCKFLLGWTELFWNGKGFMREHFIFKADNNHVPYLLKNSVQLQPPHLHRRMEVVLILHLELILPLLTC